MKNRFAQWLIIGFAFLLAAPVSPAQVTNRRALADQVRTEFLHAWNGYKKYCWGHDDLKPLTKTCRDWYGTPIYMTPVDSLDRAYAHVTQASYLPIERRLTSPNPEAVRGAEQHMRGSRSATSGGRPSARGRHRRRRSAVTNGWTALVARVRRRARR